MTQKYLGKKSAQELAGAAVTLKRPVSNGLGQMPAGTKGIIDNPKGYVKEGKIIFLADGCSCCGFKWRVYGLGYADLELVTEQN